MALKALFAEAAHSGGGDIADLQLAYKPGTAFWSASAWVWIDAFCAAGYAMPFAQLHDAGNVNTTERGLAIYRQSWGHVFGSYTYEGGGTLVSTTEAVPTGTWAHVGVSAVAGGRHVLYINGRPSVRTTGGSFYLGYGSDVRMVLGTAANFGGVSTQFTRLRVADIAMWDVQLSDDEMADLGRRRARPRDIRYARCFADFPLTRTLLNMRAPAGAAPDVSEITSFRLDQSSPFDGRRRLSRRPLLRVVGPIELAADAVASAVATAALSTSIALLGDAASSSVAAAALSTGIPMVADADASAIATAALSAGAAGLAADAAASAIAAADLGTAIVLAADAASSGVAAAALSTAVVLAADAVASAVAAADLTVAPAGLAADALASAAATADLGTAIVLVADATAAAAATAALSTAIVLAADAAATATVAADLAGGAANFAADATSSAVATADLSTAIVLEAASSASATAAADLTATGPGLAAGATAAAAATAALSTAIRLVASADAAAVVTADLAVGAVYAAPSRTARAFSRRLAQSRRGSAAAQSK